MLEKINCLFIHTPKLYLSENNTPLSEINCCAMGLFPLCKTAQNLNCNAEILHLGLEKYLDKKFLLSKYIKKNNIKFIAFSLHWYPQIYDVLETAGEISKKCPDIFIMLGGYSASYFAKEILEHHPFINAIIQGEGELPTELLLKELMKSPDKRDFSLVPNLIWKNKNNELTVNTKKYCAKSEELSTFTFFDSKLMKNYESYSKIPYTIDYSKKDELNNTLTSQVICLGRGCLGNCVWCAGGYKVTRDMTGRDFISYRDINSVISEIKMLKYEHNIELFRLAFDPDPKNKDYLISLFNKLKDTFNKEIKVELACHSLPDDKLIHAFKKSCCDDSIITIAPEFKNEILRKKYKSFFYTNEELEHVLDMFEKLKINSELYFSRTFENSNEENNKTQEYAEFLKNNYKFIKNCYIFDTEIVPGSYWTREPEKYNLPKIKTFQDYYNETKGIKGSFENLDIF